ncbi:hypothetical protein EAS68_05335 [Legionella jordanis]|uniref:hypothetical protein n=1 Tax=Legionella jordanis TaxID=456 RepID=UPI000F006C91|nr:hypothetical protein [Legionella jordanis]RMX21129.1 hypothetical protein EAS68_05335 [Legionella jordanis]
MKDPLAAFEDSLCYMFELQTRNTGTYINREVQHLKNALENYKNGRSLTLRELIMALKRAFPVVENYVDGYLVKLRMEALAKANGYRIHWEEDHFRRKKGYPYFHYAKSVPESLDFISWLSECAGLQFSHLDRRKQAEIILHFRLEKNFITKLTEHLSKQPDFLINLALESTEICINILHTRLGFEINNPDLAKIIVHHSTAMIDHSIDLEAQFMRFVEFWDASLERTGRSIAKLMDDPEASFALKKLPFFEVCDNENTLKVMPG